MSIVASRGEGHIKDTSGVKSVREKKKKKTKGENGTELLWHLELAK